MSSIGRVLRIGAPIDGRTGNPDEIDEGLLDTLPVADDCFTRLLDLLDLLAGRAR